MTGTQHLSGPGGTGLFANLARGVVVGLVALGGLFILAVSATFAAILIGIVAMVAVVAVGVFWLRAKLTGRPFGPRAVMEARMAELRAQMDATGAASPFGAPNPQSEGVTIDLQETPQGWTVER